MKNLITILFIYFAIHFGAPQPPSKLRRILDVCNIFRGYQDPPNFSEISRKLFNFDFSNVIELYRVLIWKITGNHQLLASVDYDRNFKFVSNSTYLIVSRKSDYQMYVYYWSGKSSSKLYTKTAGRYAIELYVLIRHFHENFLIHILRELEGLESLSLKHTLNLNIDKKEINEKRKILRMKLKFGEKELSYLQEDHVDHEFPLKLNKLYLIKGSRIKKIPMNGRWIHRNNCLVLELLYPDTKRHFSATTLWCGENTSPETKEIAKELGKYCFSLRHGEVPLKIIEWNNRPDFNKFSALLKTLSTCPISGYEEDDSTNDNISDPETFEKTRDEAVKLIEISDSYSWNRIKPKSVIHGPISTDDYVDKKNFILDSGSIAGVFVRFDPMTNKDTAIKTVQYVEDYLEKNYPNKKIPVRLAYYIRSIFDFNTVLVDSSHEVDIDWDNY